MKRKPIRIDWDELETAFSNKNEELVYYLDTVTGHVHLEGEGEEDSFDEDDDLLAEGAASAGVAPEDATRLYVEPPDDDIEVGWMREFAEEADDFPAEVADQLRQALDGEDPLNAFRDLLRDHADQRDRWFLFRSDQVHEYIQSWLDANDIHPAAPPPWE